MSILTESYLHKARIQKMSKNNDIGVIGNVDKGNVMPGQDYLIALQAYSTDCFVKL